MRMGKNEQGYYAVRKFEGTASEILALIPEIQAAGGLWDFDDSYSGAKCVIVARFATNGGLYGLPDTEEIQDDWEFTGKQYEKDLLSADVPGATLTQVEIREIETAIAGQTVPNISSAAALEAYKAMLWGQKSVKRNAPVLRHTSQASKLYEFKSAIKNVDRILTTNKLVADNPNLPLSISNNLPNQTWTQEVNTPTKYYGWYKNHPDISVGARNKQILTQTWEYGLWTLAGYGAVIDA